MWKNPIVIFRDNKAAEDWFINEQLWPRLSGFIYLMMQFFLLQSSNHYKISLAMLSSWFFLQLLSKLNRLQGALDKYNNIPIFFPEKVTIFLPLELNVGMGNDYMLSFTFWIDLLLKKYEYCLHFLFFKVEFNINTQYISLWDTLRMMLFTKYFMKWKCISRISWKSFVIGLI